MNQNIAKWAEPKAPPPLEGRTVSEDMAVGAVKAELRASEEECVRLRTTANSALSRAQAAEEALALVVGALNEHDGVEPGMAASDDPPHERVRVLSLAIGQLAKQVNAGRSDLHTVLDDATGALLVRLWQAIGGHTKFDDAESVFGLLDLRMKELVELRKAAPPAGGYDIALAESTIAKLKANGDEMSKQLLEANQARIAADKRSLDVAAKWETRTQRALTAVRAVSEAILTLTDPE